MSGKLEGKGAVKAGVEGLVHVLANELRGRNITVNAVAPGPVATELFLEGKTEAQIKKIPPLERLGQSEDIARVVLIPCRPRRRMDKQPGRSCQWRLRISLSL
jgi:NAD(P)-dependent dehydrogenase (short-subunit alcohol dehydrogenase family)